MPRRGRPHTLGGVPSRAPRPRRPTRDAGRRDSRRRPGSRCPRSLSRPGEPLPAREVPGTPYCACEAHEWLTGPLCLGLFELVADDLALRDAGLRRNVLEPGGELLAEANGYCLTHLPKLYTRVSGRWQVGARICRAARAW